MRTNDVPRPPELPRLHLVASIMTRDPIVVDVEQSLDQAMAMMDAHSIRHLAVVRAGRLVGMLTDREVLAATGWLPMRVHESRGPSATTGHPGRVAEVMRAPAASIEPGTDLLEVGRRLLQEEQGCLAVVEDGVLVGIVTDTDLLQAYRRERVDEQRAAAEDPPAEAVMTAAPLTVHWYTTLGEAARLCREHALRHLPVLEAGLLVGLLSDRDLRRAQGLGRHADTPVDEVMTRNVLTGSRSMRASEVSGILLQNRFGAVPIAERGELLGIVTITDLLRHDVATRSAPPRGR